MFGRPKIMSIMYPIPVSSTPIFHLDTQYMPLNENGYPFIEIFFYKTGAAIHFNWGDGTSDDNITGDIVHIYSIGTYILTISSIDGWSGLLTIDVSNNNQGIGGVGILPNLFVCTGLQAFNCAYNKFSKYKIDSFTTQPNLGNYDYGSALNCYSNLLTETAVDDILQDLVLSLTLPGRISCYVDLSGSGNSPPSTLTNVNILVAADWTVNTN